MSASVAVSAEFRACLSQWLAAEEHPAFFASCAQPLKKSIRFNALATCARNHQQLAAQAGWQLSAIPWCSDGYWLEGEARPGNQPAHLAGLFYIQEASSMLPVAVLQQLWQQRHGPTPPLRVLDMAAAPGSKTTQLAAWLQGQGLLLANEYAASRLKALYTNLSRSGVANALLSHGDGRRLGTALPGWFDAILLDAPCSGEGTVRKDPSALAHWQLGAIDELASLQQQLLESAFAALRPGGLLIYSTCSLNSRENSEQLAAFIARHGDEAELHDLRPLWPALSAIHHPHGHLQIWPHRYDAEGFFVAALSKKGDAPAADFSARPLPARFPFQPWPAKEQQRWRQWLADELQLHLPAGDYWQRDNAIWLMPEGGSQLASQLTLNRIGLRIGEIHGRELRLDHDAALALGRSNGRHIAVSTEQAFAFWRGLDLDDDQQRRGDWLISWQGQPLGLVRAAQGKLRNRLPRDRVRNPDSIRDSDE